MTIASTSAYYDRTNQDLGALRARANALQSAISSGNRLAAASDDPVAAARLRDLSRQNHFSTIDATLSARAESDLALTDHTLSAFADSVIRAQELATQAANGVLSAEQRAGIATELEQIGADLVRLANSRDSAGHALFGGAAPGDAYALGPGGVAIYQGSASASDLPLGDGQSVTRGLTGPEFLDFTVNGSPTDLFAIVRTLADGLRGAVPDPAQAARDTLDGLGTALETLTTQQTVVGARLNWIELNTARREELGNLRAEEQADLGDTDLALTVAQLQQTMTVLEASQASFAKLASLSLFNLLR